MASRNFPKKVKPDRYITALWKKCIVISDAKAQEMVTDDNHVLDQMKTWCIANVGVRKQWHPLSEAQTGWVQLNDEGDWSMMIDQKTGSYIFWFKNKEDRLSFGLVWSDYR